MRPTISACASLAMALSCIPALAGQRAVVSSFGNDANTASGCTLAAPCRSFQAAHTAVDPEGEIVALDTAGYGAVVVSKSVTIAGNPGVVAGISVTSGNGVTIATAGVKVVLRGLNINNAGSAPLGIYPYGIYMTAGDALTIENCVVSRFGSGLFVGTAAKVKVVNTLIRGDTGLYVTGGATADVAGSQFLGPGSGITGYGVFVDGTAGVTTSASISDSIASVHSLGFATNGGEVGATVRLSCVRCTASNNTGVGFRNGQGTGTIVHMMVTGSMASYNGQYGFANVGDGVFQSLGNNALHENAAGATIGTITVVGGN